VFNASLMNDAIFKFKRYEDSSLSYTGIEKSVNDEVGGWDTVIRREEYEKLFFNQQATMQESEELSNEIATSASEYTNTPAVITTVKEEIKPEKPQFDLNQIYEGLKVNHKKFGNGTVVSTDKSKKYIKVTFTIGEKTFVCPSCFELGFLEII